MDPVQTPVSRSRRVRSSELPERGYDARATRLALPPGQRAGAKRTPTSGASLQNLAGSTTVMSAAQRSGQQSGPVSGTSKKGVPFVREHSLAALAWWSSLSTPAAHHTRYTYSTLTAAQTSTAHRSAGGQRAMALGRGTGRTVPPPPSRVFQPPARHQQHLDRHPAHTIFHVNSEHGSLPG